MKHRDRRESLVNRPLLHRGLAGQAEARLDWQSAIHHMPRHSRADGGAVLKAMSRTAADQPDPVKPRQAVDQEIAVGAVLVLADPEN